MSASPPFPWRRAIVFVLLTAWMSAGPLGNLVLGLDWHPLLKPWRMYYGFGTQVCEVEYVQLAANGRERTLDRYELLGYQPWRRAPHAVRNLPDGPAIGSVGRQLCEALPAKRPDVRATAQCATVHGWRQAMDREQNLCRLGPTEVRALTPQPGRR